MVSKVLAVPCNILNIKAASFRHTHTHTDKTAGFTRGLLYVSWAWFWFWFSFWLQTCWRHKHVIDVDVDIVGMGNTHTEHAVRHFNTRRIILNNKAPFPPTHAANRMYPARRQASSDLAHNANASGIEKGMGILQKRCECTKRTERMKMLSS